MANRIDPNKKYNRIFCFGCSYTQYTWPTWAAYLALHFPDAEVINAGASGASNTLIRNSVEYAAHLDNINSDDLVVIVWTTAFRESIVSFDRGEPFDDTGRRLTHLQWNTLGDLCWLTHVDGSINHNEYNKILEVDKKFEPFNEHYFKYFYDPVVKRLETFNHIVSTATFLKGIGVDFFMSAIQPLTPEYNPEYDNQDQYYWWDQYKDKIHDLIPNTADQVLFGGGSGIELKHALYGTDYTDSHPLPSEHFKYAKWMLGDTIADHVVPVANAYNELNDKWIWECLEAGHFDWNKNPFNGTNRYPDNYREHRYPIPYYELHPGQ